MKTIVRFFPVFTLLLSLQACKHVADVPFNPMKDNLSFDSLYPKVLTLPDGSRARRIDNILVLRYDSTPPIKDITPSLKSSEYSPVFDSLDSRVNNSQHHVWLNRLGRTTTLKSDIDQFGKNLTDQGHPAKWIAPAYQLDSVQGNYGIFIPLPHTLIVKSSLLSDKLKKEFERIGLNQMPRELPGYTIFSLDKTATRTTLAVSDYLQTMQEFKTEGSYYFENVPLVKPLFADPTDPLYPGQKSQLTLIQVPDAWPLAGTNLVKVALIDMGCNVDSDDLRLLSKGRRANDPNVPAYPYYLSDQDHGTAVANLMGAISNNHVGIAGVGRTILLYPIALVDGSDTEVAEAITAAMNEHVSIVNMSIGAYSWRCSVLDPVIKIAHDADILLCAASGNEGFNNWMAKPAIDPNVMAIGGSNGNNHWPSSNYGDVMYHATQKTGISVVAPAVNCPTVDYHGVLMSFTGTSASCPIVVGVASLLKSVRPGLTAAEIRNIIESTADKVGAPSGGYVSVVGYPNGNRFAPMGYGRVNAWRAITKVASPPAASF